MYHFKKKVSFNFVNYDYRQPNFSQTLDPGWEKNRSLHPDPQQWSKLLAILLLIWTCVLDLYKLDT
jgi:hypothetical protein